MGQFKVGNPGGPGRRPKAIKFARPIARAEKQIADRLPELIDNLFVLASGGYERVEEEWQPAGLVYVGSGEFARRAFPELEPDVLVMVKRKSSIADRDRQANEYLINRILGKPIERAEIAGANGGPIQLVPVDYRAGLDALKPEDDQE
jgi:hypothetical protein